MRLRATCVPAVAALVVAASSCTGGSAPAVDPGPTGTAGTGATGSQGDPITAKDFDASNFGASATVDNTYFPLEPGMRLVYEGDAMDGKRRVTRRVVMTVTGLTKEILGVPNVVIWERDYTDGELTESELAFFGQDDGGNVWQFGEYPEEYEDGEFVGAVTWLAGLAGARAGIHMMAHPRLGTRSYEQGFAPRPVNWADRGRVYRMGERTCVPAECYRDVLVIEEFDRAERGAFQLKFYAPGVGVVRVGWRGKNEEEQERLLLVKAVRLGPGQLADVHEEALAMEERAYRVSPDVYGQTVPLEVPEP
jgi:hypothetical protein